MNIFDPELSLKYSAAGLFAAKFVEQHQDWTEADLIKEYGRPKITAIKIFLEADRQEIHPRLYLFQKSIEAYDNKGPAEVLDLIPWTLPIALHEFKEFRNLQPLAMMIERGMPQALNSKEVQKIVAAKLRDNLSAVLGETRGHRKKIGRVQKSRNEFILMNLHFLKGQGHPIYSGSDYDNAKPTACSMLSEMMEKEGLGPITPVTIYKVWRRYENSHNPLVDILFQESRITQK